MAAKDVKTPEKNITEQKDALEPKNIEQAAPENGVREITVSFDEAKLKALDFYLKDHNLTAQDELQNYLATMFMRAVPAEVRRFNFPGAEQELQDKEALFAGPVKATSPTRGRDRDETPEEREAREATNARNRERRRQQREQEQIGQPTANPTPPGQGDPSGRAATESNPQQPGNSLGLTQSP